jgi:hypothetical protein
MIARFADLAEQFAVVWKRKLRIVELWNRCNLAKGISRAAVAGRAKTNVASPNQKNLARATIKQVKSSRTRSLKSSIVTL